MYVLFFKNTIFKDLYTTDEFSYHFFLFSIVATLDFDREHDWERESERMREICPVGWIVNRLISTIYFRQYLLITPFRFTQNKFAKKEH